jgi:imidazole glycerol-phosphate synthase subunit HisF
MLKKRIVATLLIKDGIVVQSVGFKRYLPVGKPAIAVEFLNNWGVDEIILLDISATRNGCPPDYAMVKSASVHCRVPLTVGGGIIHIDHVSELMHCGADKVAFNQAALYQPNLITKVAQLFGDQCVVASIDGILTNVGHQVYDYWQRKALNQTPADLAIQLQSLGAGEILINSVDRDGSYQGFDRMLIDSVCAAVTLPVICCGGAGHPKHFVEVFQRTHVSAAAAANFFHFTEHSVTTTKALINQHISVRHETYFDYQDSHFGADGRLLKRDDRELEDMLFVRIQKEVI